MEKDYPKTDYEGLVEIIIIERQNRYRHCRGDRPRSSAVLTILLAMIFTVVFTAMGAEVADTSVVDTVGVVEAEDVDDVADFAESETKPTADIDEDADDEKDFAEYAAEDAQAIDTQQKLGVVRRDHNYGRQVKLAIVMMTFIVLALATSQSWNPR